MGLKLLCSPGFLEPLAGLVGRRFADLLPLIGLWIHARSGRPVEALPGVILRGEFGLPEPRCRDQLGLAARIDGWLLGELLGGWLRRGRGQALSCLLLLLDLLDGGLSFLGPLLSHVLDDGSAHPVDGV